jgi:transcriptional regulator with XRE-family HTH domain
MRESFGARLRQQRERQDIALTAIAEQTKIKLSLLEALERGDTSNWPSGIFRRAFARAYAKAIGLDPEEMIREFLAAHPDPAEELVEPVAGGVEPRTPPIRLRYLIKAAVASLSGRRSTPESTSRMDAVAAAVAVAPPALPLAPAPFTPDLQTAARLCTELGKLDDMSQLPSLLDGVAGIFNAVGLIVWLWDPQLSRLRPSWAHGYSEEALAQLPRVGREGNNATAAAFRSARTCVVRGSERTSGAVTAPLLTPDGPTGVLAMELRHGTEQRDSVRALVTIFAAQLATVIRAAHQGEISDRRLA